MLLSRDIKRVKPKIALRGVRNSWLMLARNSLLALFALTAASLASFNPFSASYLLCAIAINSPTNRTKVTSSFVHCFSALASNPR